MSFELFIGTKHLSSWSLRGWLAMKMTGQPFTETLLDLYNPQHKIAPEISPSRKVPALHHTVNGRTQVVWDSLAIAEYLAELFPQAGLWPREAGARAQARSISAEMHSGFQALRTHLSMDMRRKPSPFTLPEAAQADIQRIQHLWRAAGGGFLFGEFSFADAMFAPVVSRFKSYGVRLEGNAAAYAEAVWQHPFIQQWVTEALRETAKAA